MRLQSLAEKRGVSGREVARQIGAKYATVATWFSGKFEPRISDAVKLAHFFGVSLDELAGQQIGPLDLTPQDQLVLELVRKLGHGEALARLAAVPHAREIAGLGEPGVQVTQAGRPVDPPGAEAQPRNRKKG